jgi:hypothetical protein
MKVKLLREHDGVPAGSVLQEVVEIASHYQGVWSSMWGSYIITVPKKYCTTEIKEC